MAKSLLVVEDDIFLIRAYETMLAENGFAVRVAHDGDEAKKMMQDAPAEAVILDLIMPKNSGIEFLEFLRGQPAYEKIPVIVATNLSSPENEERCRKLGVTDYFIKSNVPIAQIVERIKTVLQQ